MEADIAEAALWYDEQRTGLGEAFLEAVEVASAKAVEAPTRFPVVYRDLRRVLVPRFPYALYFREAPTEVFFVACFHLHRDPRSWQARG